MLTETGKSRLRVFWAGLSPEIRSKLLSAAKAGAALDPASKSLFETLTELNAGEGSDDAEARRRFFEPMSALIGDPEVDPPSRAYFTAQFVQSLWGWLDEQSDGQFARDAQSDTNPAWDASWAVRRREAGEAVRAFVDSAATDRKSEGRIIAMWGASGLDSARDASTLLLHGSALQKPLSSFPEKIVDLDPDLCTQLRDAYEKLVEDAPEAALWLLLLVLARLSKPAQIFRAIEKIGRRGDDLLVSKTDLATVGDAVFKDAEHFAARLKHAPQTLDDAKVCVDGLAHYTSITVGMTREFGIRKDGRWGKQLFGLRSQVSTDLEKIFATVPKILDKALPVPRKGKGGVFVPVEPEADTIIQSAAAHLHFVAGAHEWATQAAVGSIQKKTEELATSALDDCSGSLINIAQHSDGENQDLALQGLEVVAKLTEAAGQVESASLIRRRSAAALAA
tara:strand:- start:2188 stop:3540 length:1353 start_codon:yes stop_codon:yes gene_type:complete